MNIFNGDFTQSEIDTLNNLVDNWTFWYTDSYYARDNRFPSGRINVPEFHDLYTALLISKRAGRI